MIIVILNIQGFLFLSIISASSYVTIADKTTINDQKTSGGSAGGFLKEKVSVAGVSFSTCQYRRYNFSNKPADCGIPYQ
jgi:hypothetical protein